MKIPEVPMTGALLFSSAIRLFGCGAESAVAGGCVQLLSRVVVHDTKKRRAKKEKTEQQNHVLMLG